MSRPGCVGVTVGSLPSTWVLVATMNDWLAVTRASLLWFVGQLAKKAGVEKKLTRGVLSTIVLAVWSAGTLKKAVVASPDIGCRMVTILQFEKSAVVNIEFAVFATVVHLVVPMVMFPSCPYISWWRTWDVPG